jgi:predicted amidophosphoribosyltransferase
VPEAVLEKPRFCAGCGHPVVVADATFCKECGSPLATAPLRMPRDPGWRPLAAAALSIVPGLGHLYRGYPARATMWFFAVIAGYFTQPLGYLLHLVCAASAALTEPAREVGMHRMPRRAEPGPRS